MKKHRQKPASTWSKSEKKSITSIKDLSAKEWHQVDYAQTKERCMHKKAAMARMDERIRNALRFL